jgi:hypothetical protein
LIDHLIAREGGGEGEGEVERYGVVSEVDRPGGKVALAIGSAGGEEAFAGVGDEIERIRGADIGDIAGLAGVERVVDEDVEDVEGRAGGLRASGEEGRLG